ncbi:MAG: CBS domain-containing protein [Acidobacteriota bacterium]
MPVNNDAPARPGNLAEADILEAMRGLGGYLDISPADALAIYRLAYDHALARLGRDVPVRDIMTARVVLVAPGSTALEAARTMAEAGVSGLPVCQGNAVVGVLSIKDLLRLLALPAQASPAALTARLLSPADCAGRPAAPALGQTPVATLMTSPAVVVAPDTPRSEAARIMAERSVNRLPVVDAAGLCGIVSRGDVVRSCRGAATGCPL